MHRDVKAADRMLTRLSELLRAALDHSAEHEVSLQEELAFLEAYIEIERARFGDRLSVNLDVQPNVLDARVPHMILQPLVENAIQHGIAPRAAPGHVTIRARGRRGMLDIEVCDDGPGARPGTSFQNGVGLVNTRARLDQLYGDNYSFEPGNSPDGGFRVSIAFPFRPVAEVRADHQEESP
jgi:LytS/YehU family sensor histidine kinase